jgi:PleD family two-component response regulator
MSHQINKFAASNDPIFRILKSSDRLGFNMTMTRVARKTGLDLARVLVADDHPASRLTLQTVLEAGGYQVDTAATAAEAVGKLDTDEYALVLTEMAMETLPEFFAQVAALISARATRLVNRQARHAVAAN